jgi:polysaccharide export outer membrane protein
MQNQTTKDVFVSAVSTAEHAVYARQEHEQAVVDAPLEKRSRIFVRWYAGVRWTDPTKVLSLLLFAFVLVLVSRASASASGSRIKAADSSGTQDTQKTGAVAAGNSERPMLQRRNPRYHLSEGDILQVDFPLTPEFSRKVTIAPDGYITLMGVGDLYVRGLTLPQLRESLKKAYSGTLHNPIISITLQDFQKPYFVVGGQVGKPGKYDLRGDTSVLEALQIAGGLTDSAKHSEVLLFRHVSSDWLEVKKLDAKRMLRGKDLAEDIELRPGDMVFVPKNTISKIARFVPVPSMGMYLNQF